jgi:hypothetical protein
MAVRWIRILMAVGIVITIGIFAIAFCLLLASLIWPPQNPQSSAQMVNPFMPTQATTTAASTGPAPQQSAANIAPDVQRTAELETIARALESYRRTSGNNVYPSSLVPLVQDDYLVSSPDPSYLYAPDPGGAFYSVCNLVEQQYECVTSDVGTEDPITFSASGLDTSALSSWKWFSWNGTTTLYIMRPPGWAYSMSGHTATLSLSATDQTGNAIAIARLDFTVYAMRPSQTLEALQKQLVAGMAAKVASTSLTSINGYPAYLSGLQGLSEQPQLYDGTSVLLSANTPGIAYQLNFFSDRTLAPYTTQTLNTMMGSITVRDVSGN